MAKKKNAVTLVAEEHGEGEKLDLNRAKLSCLQRICKPFRESIERNCNNYALYRCNITANDNIIYAILSGSDDNGNISELQFAYDFSDGNVYSRKIKVKNEGLVAKELYNLVENIVNTIPYSVGMLDFPIEGNFKEGFQMGYNKEPGTALIIIKDSLSGFMFNN